ncbi:MAG TPA: Type 1 glutamine amidotransferase-like domain-containing protein, partial [Bacteroidia bacterium]|nr:Type 1 glutamine amidotransferase-like domain-containing protein [Bacteroidia bacterium]
MRLLLLSNSKIPGLEYLEFAEPHFIDFLGKTVKNIAFVPYAGVTLNWDEYEAKVQKVFHKLGYPIADKMKHLSY